MNTWPALSGPAPYTRDEVIDRIASVREALRALGVSQLRLFGSYARDEAGPLSDLDVLVDFSDGAPTPSRLLQVERVIDNAVDLDVEASSRSALSDAARREALQQSIACPL